MRYIAFLRGINVSGHRPVPMADLRALLVSRGFDHVSTYLQSGNVLFDTERTDREELEGELAAAIEERFGFDVPVLLRSPEELAAVLEADPLPHALAMPSRYHVCFLSGQADAAVLEGIEASRYAPDEFRRGDRCLYLWYPEGAHVSKLTNAFWERHLGLTATSRNWNTVTRLREMAARP